MTDSVCRALLSIAYKGFVCVSILKISKRDEEDVMHRIEKNAERIRFKLNLDALFTSNWPIKQIQSSKGYHIIYIDFLTILLKLCGIESSVLSK